MFMYKCIPGLESEVLFERFAQADKTYMGSLVVMGDHERAKMLQDITIRWLFPLDM